MEPIGKHPIPQSVEVMETETQQCGAQKPLATGNGVSDTQDRFLNV